ncbi:MULTISPECIES: valine--tRNA ligase [Agrobacterium]|jgi:valyl-tRNA synthetase|uniref:Valine--tRNA ligase n=1 Tax=Agrobacterium fabrum (strain C58 / ATCC 33970) TaxID=176299 RepID=SYV_AGRFC|nr:MULTISPECIES: valine--tRNA ligase [Agrobacterium]Q8UEN6.1 RecName: Full=Valine--tRNA ligase; AltName: Full=Valyl-tRNA synthetase; Short=ValRS [Agrobacterium fabrum str. C58]KEY50497.1 valyl-tRNA synthetase [Agrobacterium tumefaciens]AAK87491.1 valyl-tRNA synthetase [Agrobacterium fabrum str. C58]EGL63744.1 valyl-tRNA synthetase [Agrobacterium sp. ATCC 31749]KJX88256.1 valyl-tRNA synthetase [Agrobacterium tumefaciens]MCR6724817.1 valine--tRNA ligase [Agrobacterium fabrum]
MLEKTYDSASVEPKIAKAWDEANAFRAGANAKPGAETFTIVIPPPNVTGSLHMGHALNNTLQDILVRFERMRGKDVLWQPGMDHAGIATQMVVERKLMENQLPGRREMGREAFVEKVWEWKAESGGLIFNQLKRLGASCDWSRERFTMDEGLSEAVLEVFVTLYKQNLIYKAKRLVNWDPKLQTAISDMEVEQIEVKGNLWHFRYPLEKGVTYEYPVAFDADGTPTEFETRDYIVVATTRPETMLGDTGVAVNPEDERYKGIVGKHVILPIVGRKIPIVADDYADPTAGTGAVKITPAHDFNDFEVGKRCGLRAINVMNIDGTISIKENEDFLEGLSHPAALHGAWDRLEGQDRFTARKIIVEIFEEAGLLDKIEPHKHVVPHGDRGGVPIEPRLTDQWWVDNKTLAQPAIASVREGRTNFVPKNWENTYFQWMENIQPWCISRQLWWGHQIPAWYGPDGQVFVEKTEEEALQAAIQHYIAHEGPWKAWVEEKLENFAPGEILTRDEDVLDTWFSSALWPFSTLGWPEQTPELARYYPTNVLVTGFDIIPFWVVRMMQMGLHFMKDDAGNPVEPFSTVYIHALVRDKNGQKMSKSKGNVIDPLELIDEYGADALRFTLAIMAAQGRDVKLDPARIAGYRNFGTKLWNATRFAEMNGVKRDPHFLAETASLTINRWILTELANTARDVTAALENFRFNDASGILYRFVWNQFCDWYLELLKPVFSGEDEEAKRESQACAAYVLEEIYKLLHPFMPFMTEELWAHTAGEGEERDDLLCLTDWPEPEFRDDAAAAEINWLIDLVSGIRSARAEMNVPPGATASLVVVGANTSTEARLDRHAAAIRRLARADEIRGGDVAPKGSAQIIVGEATVCLPLGNLVDLAAEQARLEKAIGKVDAEMERIDKKLSNEKFVANADPEVVAAERERKAELDVQLASLRTALTRVSEAG